ncbi:hypothetical protein QTP88_004221 [Uroleucon formosanum]
MNPNENEDTKYCFNCRRNIPLINHVMHIAYCHRNLKLCMKCDEPFLASDYDEHLKTMHSVILCDACSEKLEAIDLESHKLNDCCHRMQTCNYCQIDVEACLLPVHADVCSSRTERCNSCGQFIMLKFLDVHQESHERKELLNVAKPVIDDSPSSLAAYPPLIKKVPNIAVTARQTTRTTSMPTLRLHESSLTNHRVMPPVKRNNDQPQINTDSSNDNTHKDPKKNMPIVDTPSDLDDDDDDEFPTLGAYSTSNNHCTNINNHLANEYNNYSDTLESVKLPCEFCLKMIDSENLVLHETGCRPDLATFHNVLQTNNKNTNSENDNFPIPPHDLDTSSSSGDSELNLNTLSLSSEDEDDSEKINVEKLPCEFCEKLISIKKFVNHQWRCEKLHLDLSRIHNFDKDVYPQPINTNTKFPKSVNLLETQRNLFKTTSVPANLSGRTLILRNSEANAQSPASSTYDPQTIQILPRVKLNRQNPSRPNVPMDNRYVNNSARNNYVQFISNSRLNHSELASATNNSPAYLNPSSGAIPKQKNMKASNNRRVINDLSKKKRRDSDSSSD